MSSVTYSQELIAPCGINCGTCYAFMRNKNKCYGCLENSHGKRKSCQNCKIKNCEFLEQTVSNFCYDCTAFPCRRLTKLDKRYSTRYRASLIRNLLTIREIGISDHLTNEIIKWTCPFCGSGTSIHSNTCPTCNRDLNPKSRSDDRLQF